MLERRGVRDDSRAADPAPGTVAAASAPGLPPDAPSVANRLTPSASATACAPAAIDASPNCAGDCRGRPIREHYLVTEFDADDESRHVTEVCWPIFQTTPSS
jgi:hypothetical protein